MIIVIDTETTGLDPKSDAIVELAAVTLLQSPEGAWQLGPHASSLVAPGRRMHPAAQAQHHLTDEMLRDAPKLPQALDDVLTGAGLLVGSAKVLAGEIKVYNPLICFAAHNAAFDKGFLQPMMDPRIRTNGGWLCTMRAAKHVWPDAPGYSNQVLRYHVPGLDKEIREHLPGGLAPHRALYDALCTAVMLRRMLTLHPPAELLAMQVRPILLKTCNMKKHKGTPWAEVPREYLQWVLRADPPFDEDIRHTAAHYSNAK